MAPESQELAARIQSNDWRALFSVVHRCAQLEAGMVEEILKAELNHYLDCVARDGQPDIRNGYRKRTMPGHEDTKIIIRIPRDRANHFVSRLLPHHRRQFNGFAERILSMYARGPKAGQIERMLASLYDDQLPGDLAPHVVESALRVVREWQGRPLEPFYPVVLFGTLPASPRWHNLIRSHCIYYALGLRSDSSGELLGLWIRDTSNAAFWANALSALALRGLEQISVAITNNVSGIWPTRPRESAPMFTVQCKIGTVHRYNDLASLAFRQALVAEIERRAASLRPSMDPLRSMHATGRIS